MKSFHQLLRQPFKLIAGILLISLATAILTICVGQYIATDLTRSNLDDRYDTIALLTDEAFWALNPLLGKIVRQSDLPEETQRWIEETVQNRTDLVKTVSSTGLVSAYIPELSIDNFSQYENGYYMGRYNYGYPYRCAMLTVTLTKIGTVEKENATMLLLDEEVKSFPTDITLLCVGTVESVVGLEKGFEPVIGKTIVLQITVPNKESFDELNLQVGQTYLVYGEDFNNGDREESITQIILNVAGYEEMFGKLQSMLFIDLPVYEPTLEQFDCILTLRDPASLPAWIQTHDENGNPNGMECSDLFEIYYWDGDILKRDWIPLEEYAPVYQLPTITPLNGSVDNFLTSEEGALWQEALDKMEINNHGFPVLCVEKLGYQPIFARKQARIVEGRDFTESELANGEKVCIISQSVATKSGVQVGDTIELKTYGYDLSFELQRQDWFQGGEFPSAALYSEAVGFTSEMETYTIVGLYRQEDAWEDSYDSYGLTPNTVFVPKSSVTAEMQIRDKGIYSTLILQNGKMDEFKELLAEDDHSNWFVCYDQGYSEFVASLDAYEEVSEKALYIGIAAYTVLMLLFVFLFPVMQRKMLITMLSFGAPRGKRIEHICVSAAAILLPGTVLGAFAGSKLWTQVAARLMQSLNIEIPLEANMPVIAPTLAAAHLLLMMLVVLFTAILLSGSSGAMKRK